MAGAAVSMYVPKENSMYVQVSRAAPYGSEYSLIAVDVKTGKETMAYGVFFNNENVKLLSLVYDETDGKTFCFIHQINPNNPKETRPFFGYLQFSAQDGGRAVFTQVGDEAYVPSEPYVNSVYLPDKRVIISSMHYE